MSLPLGIGTIEDVFHSFGTSPSCMDLLNRIITPLAMVVAVALSIVAEISSGPLALVMSMAYKKKRNQVANELKRAKKKFFKSLNPSNPKSFWKAAKIMTKKKSRIPVLKPENGELISDDYEKAEALNKFFSVLIHVKHR